MYRVSKDSFFKQLTRYPQHELEILKANIESNLELGKYVIGLALLITWICDRAFNDYFKITELSAAFLITICLGLSQMLATQLTRVNWLKIAIAKKNKV